jgi:hypothetical protein
MSMIFSAQKITQKDLDDLVQNPEKVHDYSIKEGSSVTDVDQSWHGIHFLLTGEAWWDNGITPFTKVIFALNEIGQEDVGYGPMRYLPEKELKEVYISIEKLTREDLYKKFNPEEMIKQEIHPFYTSCTEEDFEYIWDYFQQLREFYKSAMNEGVSVLQYLT